MSILRLLVVFSFVLTPAMVLFSAESLALRDRCPRHEVKTDLKAKRKKTSFQRAPISGINDYLNRHNVLAFVQNPLNIELHYKFRVEDIGENHNCVVLEKVQAYYIASPRIVMPADFKKSSCEYKIILEHEKRHLQVHYDYHEASVSDYQAFLGRIARNVPIERPVRSQEELLQVQQNIKNYFSSQFFEQVGKSLEEMDKLQKKIDSPQEYLFTGRRIERCGELEEKELRQNKKSFHDNNE